MPFEVKDCTLITRMAGISTAMNLRELQERVIICPEECLFHHFSETVIRPTFDDPEFHNDFAVWARRQLRDRVLAERLGIINPYKLNSLEELRLLVLDIIEERLSEVHHIPWAPPGHDFQFMQAVTVVFDTGMVLKTPEDLCELLPRMSHSSIYYHFVEARRRCDDKRDDFSNWLDGFDEDVRPLTEALGNVEFYFVALWELQKRLIRAVEKALPECAHE
ncbi:hypothetical protein GF420_04780 [candidate division GN15 bacterium]|nr:hypothetical protein [candidate division GN15 bacterium]